METADFGKFAVVGAFAQKAAMVRISQIGGYLLMELIQPGVRRGKAEGRARPRVRATTAGVRF